VAVVAAGRSGGCSAVRRRIAAIMAVPDGAAVPIAAILGDVAVPRDIH
jgi:hypothetical protein